MSDEYIDKEDAIQSIIAHDLVGGDARGWAEYLLENTSAVDVAPVRHGHWIEYGENKDGTHNMRCSKCGAGLKSKGHANSYYTKHKYRYCHNCGARMDGESDES